MLRSYLLPIWGIGPTAPTGGCECKPWLEEQEALIPDVDIPDANFSSLLTVGGDNNEEDREAPKIDDGKDVMGDDELVWCNVPVDAAAAAAAKYSKIDVYFNFIFVVLCILNLLIFILKVTHFTLDNI